MSVQDCVVFLNEQQSFDTPYPSNLFEQQDQQSYHAHFPLTHRLYGVVQRMYYMSPKWFGT